MSRYPAVHQWFHCNSGHPKQVFVSELPRITPRFRYQQAIRLTSRIGSGILTFSQCDFLPALEKFISRGGLISDAQYHPFDSALLTWARNVDELAIEPCQLPVAWAGIEFALLDLVETKLFSAFCGSCEREYGPDDVIPENVQYHQGIKCPQEHRLFLVEVLHVVSMRS